MARKVINVALNGVTGRMGYRQHLVRSLLSIREQGGVRLSDGTVVYPEPVLVGRSEERLRLLAGALRDGELRQFYGRLADAERGHGELFVRLARGTDGFEARVEELLRAEAGLVRELPSRPAIH